MKTIRIISLILSICLMVSALSACSIFGGAKLPDTIDENDQFIFKVIRSTQATDKEEDMAKNLRNLMRDSFECKIGIGKDGTDEYSEDAYEILVGNTNRPESAEAKEVLANSRANTNFDFIVKVIGRKVCIQVTNDEMIPVAVSWFAETFCDSIEDWSLLTSDYEFIYSKDFENLNNTVGGVDLGIYTIVKPLFSDYISVMEIENHIKFYENYGYSIAYNDDVDKETTYEILLGNADREASKSVTVEGDNYVIKVVGTKIVIKGGTSLATFRAIRHFNELAQAPKNGGEPINWTDGYVINGKYDANEAGTYTLNWADEFDGSKVDLSIWHAKGFDQYALQEGSKSSLGGKCYTYGPSAMGQLPEGVNWPGKMSYLTDGKWAFENYRVDNDFFTYDFSTLESVRFRYGVIETSLQAAAEPVTLAIWFNCPPKTLKAGGGKTINTAGNCFTEIDLTENFGDPNRVDCNVHRWWQEASLDGLVSPNYHNVALDKTYFDKNSSEEFYMTKEKYGEDGLGDKTQHVYTWYWDNHQMKFAIDGRRWCTYEYKNSNSVSVHTLLTGFTISGSFGVPTYGVTFKDGEHPDYTVGYIDYCRVYQTNSINSQLVKSYTTAEYERPLYVRYPENPITGAY